VRRSVLAAVLALAGLAATVAEASPATFTTRVATSTGGEPAVAVDPRDPRTMVVATTDRTITAGTPYVQVLVSHDAGRRWERRATLEITSDPFVAYDGQGRFYAGAVGNRPGTAGAVLSTVRVITSVDGGRTWSAPVEAIGPDARIEPEDPDGPVTRGPSWTSVDRPWITTDPNSGDVYISAVDHSDASGGQTDQTAVPWQASTVACRTSAAGYPVLACGRRYVAVSRDHGRTWSEPEPLDTRAYPADLSGGFSGVPAAAHGVLAAAYVASRTGDPVCDGCVVFGTSADGGAHWRQRVVPGARVYAAGVENPTGTEPGDPVQPYVAADPTRRGHYAVMVLDRTGTSWLVHRTTDGGRRWQGPVRLTIPGRVLLERPWLAYGPSGALGVMTRADLADGSYDVWGLVAPRGDLRFLPPVRVSAGIAPAPKSQSMIDDCSSVVLDKTTLHAVWGDTRGGAIQPWYGRWRFTHTAHEGG